MRVQANEDVLLVHIVWYLELPFTDIGFVAWRPNFDIAHYVVWSVLANGLTCVHTI